MYQQTLECEHTLREWHTKREVCWNCVEVQVRENCLSLCLVSINFMGAMDRWHPKQKPVCVFWGSHQATSDALFQLILKANRMDICPKFPRCTVESLLHQRCGLIMLNLLKRACTLRRVTNCARGSAWDRVSSVQRRPKTEKREGGETVFCVLENASWLPIAKNQKSQFLEDA